MPVNPHRALLQDVVEEISRNGFRIRPVPPEEMSKVLQEALADKQKRDAVLPLLAYAANGSTEGLGLKDADMRHTLPARPTSGNSSRSSMNCHSLGKTERIR